MAQTFLNTGTQAGNREGLINLIRDVNYKKTPLLSLAGKSEAKAILHEWMEDALDTGKITNTKAEGFTPSFAAADNTVRVRRTNNCEIIARNISVTGTQNAVDKAGLGQSSEYEKQLERRTKELSLDINKTLWQQSAQTRSADAGTAGKMSGYFDVATLTTIDAGNVVISEDIYNTLTQTLAGETVGADPDVVFCSGFNKRAISSWASPYRRYEGEDKKITNTVAVYEGDFGIQKIIPDFHVPTTKIAITQMDLMRVAYLRPFEHVKLGKTKDLDEGFVLAEVTLEYGVRKALGSITNLSAS